MPIMNTVIASGGVIPTGTKNITANGIHDVAGYANADVQVPTTAPDYYIKKNYSNGTLSSSNELINFNGVTKLNDFVLAYAYYNTAFPNNTIIDMSNIVDFGYNCCLSTFSGCSGITSVDLSGVEIIKQSAISQMFYQCRSLTSFDLSSLKEIGSSGNVSSMFYGCSGLTAANLGSLHSACGSSCMQFMFNGCSNIQTVDLHSLSVIYSAQVCYQLFSDCVKLTSVDLSNLQVVWGGDYGSVMCGYMFKGCKLLSTVNLSKIALLKGNNAFQYMFQNCTGLTSLSFDHLAYTTEDLNGCFSNMLQGCSGVTVHFPAEWQTTMTNWSNITNGMGGTNTTVLFDLPNVTTLDLSAVKVMNCMNMFQNLALNNKYPNITSVDLSGLVSVDAQSVLGSAFKNCTNLTSIDLSGLTIIKSGGSPFFSMCEGCTGLTTVDFDSLTTVRGTYSFSSMFKNCTNLTKVTFNKLNVLIANSFTRTDAPIFAGCKKLESVEFGGLTASTFASNKAQFYYLFNSTTGSEATNGCTVHFPSNFDPSDPNHTFDASTLTSYPTFGGNASYIHVAFDLPATE